MRTDKSNRRLRWDPPSPRPTDPRIIITPDDLDLFEFYHTHGYVPTPFVRLFQASARRNATHLTKRLGRLYHGDEKGPYLRRPRGQFKNIDVRQMPLVHDLAPRAVAALASAKRLGQYPLRHSSDFVHDMMKACITASLELLAPAHGIRFVSREEVLSHPDCGQANGAKNALELPLSPRGNGAEIVVPDDLFALEYRLPDGRTGKRWYALEADRNTESATGKASNAFRYKIAHYLTALRSRSYKSWWGVHNLRILTVTTSLHWATVLAAEVREQTPNEPELADRFAFAFDPRFSSRVSGYEDGQWKVPDKPLVQLFEEPWITPNGTRYLTVP